MRRRAIRRETRPVERVFAVTLAAAAAQAALMLAVMMGAGLAGADPDGTGAGRLVQSSTSTILATFVGIGLMEAFGRSRGATRTEGWRLAAVAAAALFASAGALLLGETGGLRVGTSLLWAVATALLWWRLLPHPARVVAVPRKADGTGAMSRTERRR